MNFVLNVAALLGLFFVAKKREAQRFIIDARAIAANRFLQPPPSGPLLTGQGLSQVECCGAPYVMSDW